ELGAVVLRGAQRLALRQQEIACEAVFHAHDFAHLSELADAFEQDHFHVGLSVVRISVQGRWIGAGGPGGLRLAAARARNATTVSSKPTSDISTIGQPNRPTVK